MRAAIYPHNCFYFQTHSNLTPKGQSFGQPSCHGEFFFFNSTFIEYINADLMVIHTGLGEHAHKCAKNSDNYGPMTARENGSRRCYLLTFELHGQVNHTKLLPCISIRLHSSLRGKREQEMYLEINFLFITLCLQGETVQVNNLKQPETAKSFFLIGKRFTATTIAAVPAGSGAVWLVRSNSQRE